MEKIRNLFKNTIVGFIALLIGGLLMSSCESPGHKMVPVVTEVMPSYSGKPKISGLLDLGGLDIALGDDLPLAMSDKRFSPGEWVLLQGRNLGVAQITLDGKQVPVSKYFRGQPLFQIPTRLSPRAEHKITVIQDKGESNYTFLSSHYIVVTDTDDKTIHLIRTNPNEEGGVEEDWLALDSDFKRPLFNLISSDSRFMFCINIKDDARNSVLSHQKGYMLEIATYHLAAPEMPKMLASVEIYIESGLTDASIGENNQLMLLGRQSLIILDTSNPLKLLTKGRLILPANPKEMEHTYYGDAVFLNGGTQIAALEVQNNTVTLIDISTPEKFTVVNSLAVLLEKTLPFSVDLEADPSSPGQFWVLQAPNFRLIDSHLVSDLYKRYINRQDTPPEKQPVYRLQKMTAVDNKLQLGSTLSLPDNYAAYYASFGQDGRLYITTTKMDFLVSDFSDKKKGELLNAVKNILWDSISFGRVIAVDTATGNIEKVTNGVGIYYHLVDVPDIGPVFSLMKFGPSLSFPYMYPTWGLGIKSTGTYAKRKMNYRSLFPPYSVGYVAYQY